MKNTPLPIVRRQIVLYLAALYAESESWRRKVMEDQLCPLFFSEMKDTHTAYFVRNEEPYFDVWGNPYMAASEAFVGAQPPPLLRKHLGLSRRETLSKHWGLDSEHEFYISAGFAYMTHHDWHVIVTRDLDTLAQSAFKKPFKALCQGEKSQVKEMARGKAEDSLWRAESDAITWKKWLDLFRMFPEAGTVLHEELGRNEQKGSVYLARSEQGGPCKIGFAKNVDKRMLGLQTGSSENLKLVGSFPVSGMTAEKAIHKHFSKARKSGEWFILDERDIEAILDPDWRASNGIF
jgi:hypothetical protein